MARKRKGQNYNRFPTSWNSQRRKAHSVQETSRAGAAWTKDEQIELAQYPDLTEHDVGRFVVKFDRTPTEIRTMHAHALIEKQKRAEQLERIKQVAAKRKQGQSQHP